VLDLRNLVIPVVGAPMAGGPSTVGLATAISGAGGLGFLAAGYRTAAQLEDDLRAASAATSEPVGINLFVVSPYEPDAAALAAYREALQPEATRLGTELGEPRWDDDDWSAKLEVVLDLRPAVASFTFGCPSQDVLRRLAEQDVLTVVTVTTVAEARAAVSRGAAALAVQASDAGGHRGTWDLDADPDTTPLPDLASAVVNAVDVPVVAGGGITEVADVRRLLAAGATAVQVGTAYLLADEAGTAPVHRAALTDPRSRGTALTRAYTGRWARGIENRFMIEHPDAPPGYPQLHHVTAPLRRAAAAAGDPDVAHLWAGAGYRQSRQAPAADITRSLDPRCT
jgi:nitronate monooxygenase